MNWHSSSRALFIAVAASAAFLRSQDEAPSARQLLERHIAWRIVDPTAPKVACIVAAGRIKAGGLEGTKHTVLTADGRCREDSVLGSETYAFGSDAHGAWLQNESGQVFDLAPNERELGAERCQRRWFARWPVDVLAQATRGTETIAGVTGKVVIVPMPGGSPVELVLSGDGELLAMRTRWYGVEITTRYADWRPVGGVRLPFREEENVGGMDRFLTWSTIEAPPMVDDAALRRPLHRALGAFTEGHDHAIIPLDTSASGHWFMTVMFAGKPFQALLDTGEGSTILDAAAAQQLGIAANGAISAFGVGAEDRAMHYGDEVDVELGAARWSVRTTIEDLGPLGKNLEHHVDMVVGPQLLLAFVVQLDQKNRTITLWDPKRFKVPARALVLPCYSSSNGHAVVQATVETLPPDWFLVDTGSPLSLVLSAPYVRVHDLLANRRGLRDRQIRGTGGLSPAKVGLLASFTFAGKTHTELDTWFFFADHDQGAQSMAEYAGIVGNGIMQQYVITFDLVGNRLLLEPSAERGDK